MYGHIATATGWTFSQIDELTIWDANDLFSYWQEYPPTHVLVGAYLMGGTSSHSGRRPPRARDGGLDELTQAVTLLGGTIKKKLPPAYG